MDATRFLLFSDVKKKKGKDLPIFSLGAFETGYLLLRKYASFYSHSTCPLREE